MKKNLFLAALAVVAMASCSKTEVADPSSVSTESTAIGFTTFIDRATKGAVADQTTLQTDGFGVICFQTDETNGNNTWAVGLESETPTTSAITTIMNNIKVSYTDGAWSYGDLKYWEDDTKLTFFAYSPMTQETASTITADCSDTDALPTITFTAESKIEDQVDLLAASVMNQENTGSPVSFNFDHILSKIGFTIQSSLTTLNTAVAVTDVKVTVVNNTEVTNSSGETLDADGIFTFSDGGSNAAQWETTTTADNTATVLAISAESIFDTDKYNYYMTDLEAVDGSNDSFYLAQTDETAYDITADDGYLMIVPQALDAADIIKVEVSYYYVTGTDGTPTVGSTLLTKTVYIPTITYAMGTAYTYNIKVGKDAITFASTIGVSEFTSANTGTSGNLDLN